MTPQTDPSELRNLRRVAVVTLGLLSLALAWLLVRPDASNDVVFPDGTRVRVQRVTWGAAMEYPRAGELRTRLGRWLGGIGVGALHPVFPLPQVAGVRQRQPTRDVTGRIVGFSPMPSVDRVLEPGHLELIVVQGTNSAPFRVDALDDSGGVLEEALITPSLPMALYRDELRWVDWRSDRLRFRIRRGDVEKVVELPNPRPPSTWRNFGAPAEPLPAVRKAAGLELRLTGLRATRGRGAGWVGWMPELGVFRGDRDVTAGMAFRYLFEDADGRAHSHRLLPSEPKWRIRVQAWPTPAFEAEDGEEVVLDLPRVPGEGEWVPLPNLDSLRPLGIVGGGFSGSGLVSVRNGVRVEPEPGGPSNVAEAPQYRAARESWSIHGKEDHTVLWLVLDSEGVERPFWKEAANAADGWPFAYRAADGLWRSGNASVVGFSAGLDRRLVRIDLREEQAGPIRLQIRRRFDETFLVDAPKASGPPTPPAPAPSHR